MESPQPASPSRRAGIVAACFALLWVPFERTSAQGEEASAPPTIHVVAMDHLEETLWREGPEVKTPLRATTQTLGKGIPAPDGERFRLFRKTEDEEGKEVYVQAAEARLLPDTPVQIVALFPPGDHGDSYPTQVIDHGVEAHPPNHVRFVNLSSRRLGATIMDKQGIVEPGGSLLHRYPGEGLQKLRMRLAIETADGWRRLAYRRFIVVPGARFLFLGAPMEVASGVARSETAFVLRKFID